MEATAFLFVNATKICQFKAKDFELKIYPLCLGSASLDFLANSIIKTGLGGSALFFCFL